MQFEVQATDGRKVQVEAVDWMMAMAKAMPLLGIQVSGWLCNTRLDGTVDVMDPMSGASWKVLKIGADAPARPAPARPKGPPPPPPELVGMRTPAAPAPAPQPAPPAAARPVPKAAPKRTPLPDPAPEAGPKMAPRTDKPGQITEMWSRASMNFDDDDESDEVPAPEPPPPDDLAERLFDLSTDIYLAENATAACRMALDILLQLVPSEAGSVLRGKREEGMLTFVATAGPAAKKLLGQKMHFGQGVVGASFDLGITIMVQDVTQDTRHLAKFDQQTGFQTRAVLCVPLRHQYTIFGAVELINPVGGRFAAWHVEAMETVARTVAQLLAGNR